MGNIARNMRRSTDVSSQWTEICPSDGQKSSTPNIENLEILDPSVVGMGRKFAEGGQGCIYEAKLYMPFSFEPFPVVVKKFKPYEGVSQGYIPGDILSTNGAFVCKPWGFFLKGDSLCMVMQRYFCDLRAHIDSCMTEMTEMKQSLITMVHDFQKETKETTGYDGPPLPESLLACVLEDLAKGTTGYDGPPLPEFISATVLEHLAVGVAGLHRRGITHRDLKASNILITRISQKNGEFVPYIDVILTDFETSEAVSGTGFYRAPEVLQYLRTRVPLSEDQWIKADIYSFGMVCYEVLTGRIPFGDHRPSDYDLVFNGGRPELPDYIPERMKDMIQRCWHADPSCRPSWRDILQVLVPEDSSSREDLISIYVGDDISSKFIGEMEHTVNALEAIHVLMSENPSFLEDSLSENPNFLEDLSSENPNFLEDLSSENPNFLEDLSSENSSFTEDLSSENSSFTEDLSSEYIGNDIGIPAELEWIFETSLESLLEKLKEEFAELMEFYSSGSNGFANSVYWAEEYIATAEEYASKFIVEYQTIFVGLLCNWSEYAKRSELLSLLLSQTYAFAFFHRLSEPTDVRRGDDEFHDKSRGFEKLAATMGHINCLLEQRQRILYSSYPDKEMSLIGRLFFYHAFITGRLWTEGLFRPGGRYILEDMLRWVNLKDGVEEFILLAGLMVVAFLNTHFYVLALLTFEPIILCLQYGIYKIRPGCNTFMYRSSGYRIWRLQRAWINYSRYKLLSIALVILLVYLVTRYNWKGFLTWIIIPCILRLSSYWRPTRLN